MVGAIFLYFSVFKSELIKLVGPLFSEIMLYMMVFMLPFNSELVFARNFFVILSEMLALLLSEILL
jgi:hypothetical protein